MKPSSLFLPCLTLLLALGGCEKKKEEPVEKQVPIQVAPVVTRDVPQYIATVGHMEAYEIVNIMAQVDGYLLNTYFADGADVKKGDLLYLIDQRPYLADLERAEGALEESFATMGYAQRTAKRNVQLAREEYISQDQFDSLVTNATADQATVKQRQADVDTAKINLGYTTIYSPLDARAGASQLDDGNLILQAQETTLVTLNQISPIYSVFFINEKDLPAVQRAQAQGGPLQVHLTIDDPASPSYDGELTFIDNGIDLSTGMIKLKGTHQNTSKTLWPNQYVKVQLILNTLKGGMLIPSQALLNSPKGAYVYVMKGAQTVERREVTVGQRQSDDTVVILTGLKGGERVVTVGQMNLFPGARVAIKNPEEDQ